MSYLMPALAGIGLAVIIFLWNFYRDPARVFEGDKDIVLSPADGRIKYIRKVEKGTIPVSIKGRSGIPVSEIAKTDLFNTDCWLIGIVMSIFDVHVNRAPLDGEVILCKYVKGRFFSLKRPAADVHNERGIIISKRDRILMGVILIASRLVRRIDIYAKEKQRLCRGEKIGRIVFGSQTDIIIPVDCELLVQEGMQVFAGKTPLAKLKNI